MKAIIFDLQGTLIENGIFPSPTKQVRFILGIRREFHDYVPLFENTLMTTPHTSLAEGFKSVSEAFNVKITPELTERLIGMWNKNKLLSRPFQETIDVLEDLKKDHVLVLVANIDCFTKDIITKFNLQNYFNHIYLSCDVGMLKANPEFFKNILKDIELNPEDVAMIGDSIDSDMIPSSKAGIKTILLDRMNRQDYPVKIHSLSDIRGRLND
jgi:HAD superfamily hydrolase (TIGR01549 family)